MQWPKEHSATFTNADCLIVQTSRSALVKPGVSQLMIGNKVDVAVKILRILPHDEDSKKVGHFQLAFFTGFIKRTL
jgi:hypothetical protein